MTFEALMQEAASHLGISTLQPDENGVACLAVDGKTSVFFEISPFDDSVGLVYCALGRIPSSNREEFYAALLEAQLFGADLPEGGSFGISRESGDIFLNLSVNLNGIDSESFVERLGKFVHCSEHWTDVIARGITPHESSLGTPEQYIRM